MEICFINDMGYVDQLKSVSGIEELCELNDKLCKKGLDDFGYWYEITKNISFCSDCGEIGHKKGHNGCVK